MEETDQSANKRLRLYSLASYVIWLIIGGIYIWHYGRVKRAPLPHAGIRALKAPLTTSSAAPDCPPRSLSSRLAMMQSPWRMDLPRR